MANKAKPAAKQAASKVTDAEAEKAFAEPENTAQEQPTGSLSPAESLQRDRENAKEAESLAELDEKKSEELKEVRDRNRELREHHRFHNRSETSAIIRGIKDPSDAGATADAQDGPAVKIFSGDGRVHIETEGEVVLDREATINLSQRLAEAFQAVA